MDKKFLIIFLLTLLSCNSARENKLKESEVQVITFDSNPEELKFSQVYDSHYEIIKLETTDKALFHIPTKTRLSNDYIFIFDQTKKLLLIFYRNGKLYKQLNKKGKGPGEYVSIADFAIDERDQLIYIFDDMQRKLILYDFDLNYIIEKKTPLYFSSFDCLNSGDLIFYTGLMARQEEKYRYDFIQMDKNFKIIDKILPYQFTNASRGHIDKIFKVNNSDTLICYTNYSNLIYELVENKFRIKYKLSDFNGFKLPANNFYIDLENAGKKNSEVSDIIFNSRFIYSYVIYAYNNDFLVFFDAEKNTRVSYLNMDTNIQWHTDKLIDDFGLFLDSKFYKPSFFYKDFIGYYIYPHLVKQELEKKPEKLVNPLIKELKIDDNLIIALFKIKASN